MKHCNRCNATHLTDVECTCPKCGASNAILGNAATCRDCGHKTGFAPYNTNAERFVDTTPCPDADNCFPISQNCRPNADGTCNHDGSVAASKWERDAATKVNEGGIQSDNPANDGIRAARAEQAANTAIERGMAIEDEVVDAIAEFAASRGMTTENARAVLAEWFSARRNKGQCHHVTFGEFAEKTVYTLKRGGNADVFWG